MGRQSDDRRRRAMFGWTSGRRLLEQIVSNHSLVRSGEIAANRLPSSNKVGVEEVLEPHVARTAAAARGRHVIAVTIKATGVGLYIHTQALDTSTPSGRAMFGMSGVFAEFERE
jgi:hypothetical protein